MKKHYPWVILMLTVIALSNPKPSHSSQNGKYVRCGQAFQCGIIGSITYPFFDGETRPEYCGQPGFKVGCLDGTLTQINVSSRAYFLQNIDYLGRTVTVNSTDSWDAQACPRSAPVNYTVEPGSVFGLTGANENLTYYYDCNQLQLSGAVRAIKTNCSGSGSGYYLTQAMLDGSGHVELQLRGVCKGYMVIPIHKMWADMINATGSLESVRNALGTGFDLGMNINGDLGVCEACVKSGGECGYDWGSSNFVCYCPDQDQDFTCKLLPVPATNGNSSLSRIWGILRVVIIIIAVAALSNLILARFFYRSYKNWRNIRRRSTLFGPKRYSYSRIKKMTNSFSEKLGEGGFGPVFKGALDDGRLVAVKLWKQSTGDAEEFLNEVASISRTNHANIVILLGFCFEGHKQALVYEFMPNGSLEKFVRRSGQDVDKDSLPMQTLFRIVTGVARGLQYLHQGCDTRILHFDIKPHNILLDAELNPKISDFGMARSCTRRKSTISMSAARGTAGYIAPEVFFRNYGHGVSHKSDVYSYGMMILEILGQRKNEGRVTTEERCSSVYFPQWIYARLEKDEQDIIDFDVVDWDGDKDDVLMERKMVLVALWCIQTNPLNRPSMSSVVEMLRGRLEALEVPPMPTLSPLSRDSMQDEKLTIDQYSSTDPSFTITL